MRTTLDLPEALLAEAMELTNITTKTKVIVTALEELVQKARIAEIKEYRGKLQLDIDLEQLRERR